jgi:hypothetical protein
MTSISSLSQKYADFTDWARDASHSYYGRKIRGVVSPALGFIGSHSPIKKHLGYGSTFLSATTLLETSTKAYRMGRKIETVKALFFLATTILALTTLIYEFTIGDLITGCVDLFESIIEGRTLEACAKLVFILSFATGSPYLLLIRRVFQLLIMGKKAKSMAEKYLPQISAFFAK